MQAKFPQRHWLWLLLPLLAGCAAAIPAIKSGAAAIASQLGVGTTTVAVAGAAGVGAGIGIVASDDIKKIIQEAGQDADSKSEPGTWGAYLADSKATALTNVRTAMRTQRDVQVVAGMQMYAALVTLEASYRDMRGVKFESLKEAELRLREELDAAQKTLTGNDDAIAAAAGQRIWDRASRLRVDGGVSRLRTPGPVYLLPWLPSQQFRIAGDFSGEFAKDSPPLLVVNGKAYKSYSYSRDSLFFSVNTAEFEASDTDQTTWRMAELIIPTSASNAGFGASPRSARFNVALGMLTNYFGNITVEKNLARSRAESRPRVSDHFAFSNDAIRSDESRCLSLTAQEVAEGWRIRTGSGAVTLEAPQLDNLSYEWRDLGMQSEGDFALCWKVRALLRDTGDGTTRTSNARWRITAQLQREVREQQIERQDIAIPWGGKHRFNAQPGSWKIRYTRLGNPQKEIDAAQTHHPLIRVQDEGEWVNVSVFPF